MASTIYYGKSDTVNDGVYKVIVQGLDSTVTTESDFLSPGDILNVYFIIGCSDENPTIKLYNGDIDHEIATTADTGNFIRTQSANVDLTGIWSDGELCSFTYVAVEGNTYYWYLSGAAVATADNYGRTKIVNSLEDGEYNENLPVTAGAVAELIERQRDVSLSYNPTGSYDKLIGTLTLTGSRETSSVNIYIPDFIDTDTFRIYTNELINNGPKKEEGEADTEANIGFGHPYITRIIPGSLTFTNSFTENTTKGLTILGNNGDEFVAYELADSLNNTKINSQGAITLTPSSGQKLVLNGVTEVKNAITMDDKIYYVLDVVTNEFDWAVSGSDMDLYNNIKQLDWKDDCIIQG